jgi:adenosylcobinamide-GDP ribazoletransferase
MSNQRRFPSRASGKWEGSDDVHAASGSFLQKLLDQYKELAAAIRFISIIPIPGSAQLFYTDESNPQLFFGSTYFPIVGLLLGLILYLITILAGPYIPSLALAAILVVGLVILTGGLHLDGLMDTCDGILGGTDRESKLEIMRDSRVGSFGVLGGVCVLLLKFAFLASLNLHQLSLAFFIVLPISRWAMILAVYWFPSARSNGLGATFWQTVTGGHVILAGIIALLVAAIAGHLLGIILWLGGGVFALGLGALITRNIGGLSGDSYGAIVEFTDVMLLLLLLLLHFLM